MNFKMWIIGAAVAGFCGCQSFEEEVELCPQEVSEWTLSESVISGKIIKIIPGISTMSLPPIRHYTLELDDPINLYGTVSIVKTVKFMYRGDEIPVSEGERVILWGDMQNNVMVYTGVTPADESVVFKVAETLPSLAPGWTLQNGKPVGPWKTMLNRPTTVKMPECVAFNVEQVPPKNFKEYQNSYGDGMFKVSLTNTSREIQTIDPVRVIDGKILWEQAIVAVIDKAAHVFSAAMPAGTKPLTLKPGETVTGEINTLTLKNIDWPRGGSRVYFVFAIGQAMKSNFFYYYSSLHDPMRLGTPAKSEK